MPDVTASRTLVKSAPELWTECSDADALGRHLDGFGDIRITRLEPETAVAWEGEHVSGTVTLEPSGWGTRVVLTATPAPSPPAVPVVEPEPDAMKPEPEPVARIGFLARLLGRFRSAPRVEPAVEPEVASAPSLVDTPDPQDALLSALESLGQAHHRPYSRA